MTKYGLMLDRPSQRVISKNFGIVTRWSFLLVSLLSFFSSQGQVTSSIDSTSIKLGGETKYSITVQADTTDIVVFPEGQTFLPMEVIDAYKVDTTFQAAKYRLVKKYGLTQWDSGRYIIPQQKIYINEKIFSTDSFQVEVRDVVVDTTKQKMFDIKPAIDVEDPPIDWLKWLLWLVGIALLIGLIGFIFFRRKKIKEAKEERLPPYEEALLSLQKLDNSELLKHYKNKEYYSQLTEIVKRYLDREVDDTVLEKTTDELIERLQMHKDAGQFDFDNETLRELHKILKRADLVKFAKFQQTEGQAKADRNTIEEIINETHEAIPEPTEEALLKDELYREEQAKIHKKQKIKKIVGVAIGVAVLVLAITIALKGFDTVKDSVLGNNMKEMLYKRWYKSEYGNPAVVIETPEILVRQEIAIPEGYENAITDIASFRFGDFKDELIGVSITTINYNREVAPESQNILETALDNALQSLENNGATNLIVKSEEFTTAQGITGMRAYGQYNLKKANGDLYNEKAAYEILLFKQEEGLQNITIAYVSDDEYAEKIKDRIVASVEIEVTSQQTGSDAQ